MGSEAVDMSASWWMRLGIPLLQKVKMLLLRLPLPQTRRRLPIALRLLRQFTSSDGARALCFPGSWVFLNCERAILLFTEYYEL